MVATVDLDTCWNFVVDPNSLMMAAFEKRHDLLTETGQLKANVKKLTLPLYSQTASSHR